MRRDSLGAREPPLGAQRQAGTQCNFARHTSEPATPNTAPDPGSRSPIRHTALAAKELHGKVPRRFPGRCTEGSLGASPKRACFFFFWSRKWRHRPLVSARPRRARFHGAFGQPAHAALKSPGGAVCTRPSAACFSKAKRRKANRRDRAVGRDAQRWKGSPVLCARLPPLGKAFFRRTLANAVVRG